MIKTEVDAKCGLIRLEAINHKLPRLAEKIQKFPKVEDLGKVTLTTMNVLETGREVRIAVMDHFKDYSNKAHARVERRLSRQKLNLEERYSKLRSEAIQLVRELDDFKDQQLKVQKAGEVPIEVVPTHVHEPVDSDSKSVKDSIRAAVDKVVDGAKEVAETVRSKVSSKPEVVDLR